MERIEILNKIKDLVGGKTFRFSDSYISQRKGHPTLGQFRPYTAVTRKYVYVSAFVKYVWNEELEEYGMEIKKFPICYRKSDGALVDKVALNDLYTSDLEKILEDIKFNLWWEIKVRLPKLQAEMKEIEALEKMWNKLKE